MLIIYDLDGTLFDTEYEVSRITAELANEKGCGTNADEVFVVSAGYGCRDKFSLLAEKYGVALSDEDHEYLRTEHENRKQALYDALTIPVIPYVRELLEKQAQKGHVLAVGSSNPTDRIKLGLDKTGLRHYFSDRVYGPDLTDGKKKPDPAVFELAMWDNGFAPEDSVIVEDTSPGIMAGHAARAFDVVAYMDPRFGDGPVAEAKKEEFRRHGASYFLRDYQQFPDFNV